MPPFYLGSNLVSLVDNLAHNLSVGFETSLLPPEYEQVEYIKSTGTQYINTGLVSTNTQKWYIKFLYEGSPLKNIAGAYTSDNSRRSIVSSSATNKIGVRITGISNINPLNFDNNMHEIIVDYVNKEVIADGTTTTYTGTYGTIPSAKIMLFSDRANTNIMSGKVYSAKFYENNVLVRDFIPCYRKADNVIGMYDIVGKTFYTNAGTGTFIKGPKVHPILPVAYQEVAWIGSSGTQYINTNVLPTKTQKFELTLSSATNNTSVFGVRSSANDDRLQMFISTSISNVRFRVYSGSSYDTGTLLSLEKNEVVLDMVSRRYKVNNTESSFSIGVGNIPNYPIYIFALDNAGTATTQTSTKIYSFKIYDSGTLVRNLIPCYRKSDNVIGMYDLVNNVFYTNQGTGTFSKGEDV